MRRIKLARTLMKVADKLPHPHPIHSREGLDHQPFFVVGSGRNGSTLLNRMLNQHTDLFLPSEQYFLGNSIVKFRLYNWIIWRDLVKVIAGELVPTTGSHTWDFNSDHVLPQLLSAKDKSLQFIIDCIYRAYGHQQNAAFSKWGDTTPMNTRSIPEIYKTFPEAKYLFLLRDGRDVVTSYVSAGVSYLGELANPEKAALHWQNALKSYEWLAKKTKVLHVRYEDLVTHPKSTLQNICRHLDISFQEGMLHHEQSPPQASMYREPQHEKVFRPVDTGSIGRWKYNLDSEEQKVFKLIEKELIKYGYQ